MRAVAIDMAGVVLAQESHEVDLATPVAARLKVVLSLFRSTLEQAGTGAREVMAIGIAAPGVRRPRSFRRPMAAGGDLPAVP